MAITPKCVACRGDRELTEPGGLLISPPREGADGAEIIRKMHLCVEHFDRIMAMILHDML